MAIESEALRVFFVYPFFYRINEADFHLHILLRYISKLKKVKVFPLYTR